MCGPVVGDLTKNGVEKKKIDEAINLFMSLCEKTEKKNTNSRVLGE